MRRIGKWASTAVCLAMTVLCLVFSASVFAAESSKSTAVLFLEDPWPPYTLGNEGQAPTGGIAVQIVQEVFKRIGTPVKLELHPWKRVLKMAETGSADGIMLLMYQADREAFLVFTDEVIQSRELFYVNKNRHPNFAWKDYADLKGYKIGLISGYTYGDDFLAAIKTHGLEVIYAENPETRLNMLAHGRIDVIVGDEAVTNAQIATNGEWKNVVVPAQKPLKATPFFMAFSKQSAAKALLPKVNQAIAGMKKDGTMDRIMGRRK